MQAFLKYFLIITILLVQLPSRSWGVTGTGIRPNAACDYNVSSRHNVFSEKRQGSELPGAATVSDSDDDFSISAKRMSSPRTISFLLTGHHYAGLARADLLRRFCASTFSCSNATRFIRLRRFLL